MKKLILIVLSLTSFSYASTTYIRLVNDATDTEYPLNEYHRIGKEKFFYTLTFDNFIEQFSSYEPMKELLPYFLEIKDHLSEPLIIFKDEKIIILDKNLDYILTSTGKKIHYTHLEDDSVNDIILGYFRDSITYLAHSDMYDFVKNKCSDSVLKPDTERNYKIYEINQLIEETKGKSCEDIYKDDTFFSNYIREEFINILDGCLSCLHNQISEKNLKYLLGLYAGDKWCFSKMARDLLKLVSKDEKRNLLNLSFEKVDELSESLIYDHENFGFNFDDPSLISYYTFILKYLNAYGVSDLGGEQLESLRLQTNTISDESRKELNDVLSWMLAYRDLKNYGDGQNFINNTAREALRRIVDPESVSDHKIEVIQNNGGVDSELGEDGVFITCGDEKISLYTKIEGSENKIYVSDNRYFEYANIIVGKSIPISQILGLQKHNTKLYAKCDEKEYEIIFASNYQNMDSLNLDSLEKFKFQFKNDKTINAVSTLGLVKEMSLKLATGMKFAFGMKGYKLVSEVENNDIKASFLSDLGSTDIYLPIDHAMSMSSFSIGSSEGIEFLFEKKLDNGKKIELKIYTPPYADGVQRYGIDASSDEIIEALSKRDDHNNLFVLNLSCNAEKTVPQWMHAYTQALQVNVANNILPPVVISSQRAFKTGNASEIMAHMEYPFGILELASKEGSINDVMMFLSGNENAEVRATRSFFPVSNVGMDYAESQEGKITGNIISSDGKVEPF